MRVTLRRIATGAAFAQLACLLATTASGDDWPQWRGPNRDGIWRESGIVQRFDKPQLDIVWRAKIGGGYSGPTAADRRVYVMDRIRNPKRGERVQCFDAKTGRRIWEHSYRCTYRAISYGSGPRAAVTLDSGRAYSLGTMGHFFCLDAATGTVAWQKDLDTEYKMRVPIWGVAAAPLVEDHLVIVQVGGEDNACVVAFDKETGREVWRTLNDQPSYSAPIVIEQGGKRVVVCYTGDNVVGLDPKSGRLHWKYPFPPTTDIVQAIATPVHHQDTLFLTNFFDGSLLLKLDQEKLAVKRVWQRVGPSETETDSLQSMISTPIIQDGHIYGVDSFGQLRCLDLMTGDRVWESQDAVRHNRWANIHLVQNGDNTWMFNEHGELIIAKLTPIGYQEISRTKLIEPTRDQCPSRRGGVCWSHPAFAYKHVFARNGKELVCASLAAK